MDYYTHYHLPTETMFRLDTCETCSRPVRAVAPVTRSVPGVVEPVYGLLNWGDAELPPEALYDSMLDMGACPRCLRIDDTDATPAPNTLTTAEPNRTLAGDITVWLVDKVNDDWPAQIYVQIPRQLLEPIIMANGVKAMRRSLELKKRPIKRRSARTIICELIIKRKSDTQILEALFKERPDSNATKKHCTKYRRDLLLNSEIGPELAAFGSYEHQAWAQENMAKAVRGPHRDDWRKKKAADKLRNEKLKLAAKKAEEKFEAKVAAKHEAEILAKAAAKKRPKKKAAAKKKTSNRERTKVQTKIHKPAAAPYDDPLG